MSFGSALRLRTSGKGKSILSNLEGFEHVAPDVASFRRVGLGLVNSSDESPIGLLPAARNAFR
jgi:hypothetical protein